MKKQFALLAGAFVVFSVTDICAMELSLPSEPKIFSVRDLGIDPGERENLGEIGDFYRGKVSELAKKLDTFATFSSNDFEQNIQDGLGLIAEISKYHAGFQADTNKDDLSHGKNSFLVLLSDAQEFIAEQQCEKENLVKKDKLINAYWGKIRTLKDRLDTVRSLSVQDIHEQKIALLQEIVNEARAIGVNSQAELRGEVRFKRECAPIIGRAQSIINKLQETEQAPRNNRCAKRLFDEPLPVKRSKTY